MKKIDHIIIEDYYQNNNKNKFKNILEALVKLLPKNLYVTNNINYYFYNDTHKKLTICLDCIALSDIVIIKFYKSTRKIIPEELLYLSEYHENHLFYKNCYLAYAFYNNYNISIIKMRRADGDISNIKLNINTYAQLNEMISDELYKMHINGYVHMDIKTTNILYKKNKNEYEFGLCDFELINYNGVKINPIYKDYYLKLYYIRNVPSNYTCDYETLLFMRILNLLKKNKKIKANTIP
jgi:serine/threonine protein kinase